MTTEVMQDVDGLMTAFEEFKTYQDRRIGAIETRLNRPRNGGSDAVAAAGGDLARERKALGAFVKTGDDREIKAMEVGVDPSGGWVVLPQVSNAMVRRLWDASPIRRLARIQNITTGDAWVEPIDRGESAAAWVSEIEARPALDTPQLGLLTIPLNEIYTSQQVS